MREKLDALEAKKDKLKQQQEEINQRIRNLKSKERQKKRKKETHYKFLLGAFFLNDLDNGNIDDHQRVRLLNYLQKMNKENEVFEFIKEHKNHQPNQ